MNTFSTARIYYFSEIHVLLSFIFLFLFANFCRNSKEELNDKDACDEPDLEQIENEFVL